MHNVLELLWSNNTFAGRAIILVIIGFGVAGGSSALSHRWRYLGRERRWLDTVRDRLRRAREARQEVSDGVPADEVPEPRIESAPLLELSELMEGVPADTLVGDRLASIVRMKQARAKVNVDALQQSTMLKEGANATLAFPAYVVSLVMMLGLFGTFIGLSLMVVDIQQSFPAGSTGGNATQWAESVSGLGRILAGKKTAFSATLAGLFFAIIVSGLNYALARAQSTFYDLLERFTTEELLPATVPAFDDQTPWEKLSTQLGDSFEHLKAVAAEQSRSADQMVAVEKTFSTVIDNIEAMTQRAATAPLQGMAGEMSSVIGQLTQVNGAIIQMTERLPQLIATFRQTHQATLAEIQTAMHGQQAAIERLSRALAAGSGGRAKFANVGLFAAGATVMLLAVFLFISRIG